MKKLIFILNFIILIGMTISINAEVEEIPFEEVKEIALRNAKHLWGDIYADEVIPCYDQNDNLIIWQFNFSIGKAFPARDDLIEKCRKAPKALWNEKWASNNYAKMLIGARTDRPVICGYSKGLSYDYSYYAAMEKLAAKHFKKGFQITKMMYLSFGSRWFVVTDGEKELYIKSMGAPKIFTKLEFKKWTSDINNIKENLNFTEEWSEFMDGRVLNRDYEYIPNHDEMPFYQWIYGCSPCSGSMIAGWWDNNSVNSSDYSLLIDRHWAEWDPILHEYNDHVPNAVEEIASTMGTDDEGSTYPHNIDNGMEDFIENNGYTAWCNNYYWDWLTYDNDDIWDDMVTEVNNGEPPVISIWEHTVAGMGYNSSDPYFALHDPNYPTEQHLHISDIWLFTKVHPHTPFGVALKLISPDGHRKWPDEIRPFLFTPKPSRGFLLSNVKHLSYVHDSPLVLG